MPLPLSAVRMLIAGGFWHYVRWMQSTGEGGGEEGVWYGWMWAGLLILFQIGALMCAHWQFRYAVLLGHHRAQQVGFPKA